MKKEINEKTFELNITSELLNLSKSFIWYLDYSPLGDLIPRHILFQFLKQSILFSEGLTQEEENNKLTGGYDVSINYSHNNGQEDRLMFLQYKSGFGKSWSTNSKSEFYRQTAKKNKKSPKHVLFKFNEAAKCTQHSTLRNLANRHNIQAESVLYVFPRITEKSDFKNKIGNLIYHSSFVPVLELDNQASNQTPSISINDGLAHNYKTSYDGLTSEVNFFFFFFFYDINIITELLAELICIQIERIAKILIMQNNQFRELFTESLRRSINQFADEELHLLPTKTILLKIVNAYIKALKQNLNLNKGVPSAPSRYTTIIPTDGLRLEFDAKIDFTSINYQIF